MARNVVFLVHGLGRQPEDWATGAGGPIETLQEVSERYGAFAGQDLSRLLEFVPIRYDDIFDRVLDQWHSLAEGLGQMGPLLPGELGDAVGALADVGEDRRAFLGYGGDAVLYRGFRLFAQRVQMRVIRTIAETVAGHLHDPPTSRPRFLVVAHGLGTAVAHDALHSLGTAQWLRTNDPWSVEASTAGSERAAAEEAATKINDAFGAANGLAPDHLHFEAIFMLANTSRLLHTTPEGPTESIVRPDLPANATHYCHRFFNVAHELDPIPAVLPFRLPASWVSSGETAADLRLRQIYDKDLHALGYYLRDPQVHGRLLYYGVDGWKPTPTDRKKMSEVLSAPPSLSKQAARIDAAWRLLVEGTPDAGALRDLVALVRMMKRAIQEL